MTLSPIKSNKDVAIIGGGIIGICTAYYLHQAGKKVVLIEKDEIGKACSFGNAGYITPSHFIPLAAPGMIQKGLKWMLNPKSPFFVRPSLDLDFIKWLLAFAKKCTAAHSQQSQQAILDLNLKSLELYQSLHKCEELEFQFHQNGLLMLFKTQSGLDEEAKTVAQANSLGLKAKILDKEALKALEPEMNFDLVGAAFYPEDAHIEPFEFIANMTHYLKSQGVEFLTQTQVTSFNTQPQGTKQTLKTINTTKGVIEAGEFVLATGAWSSAQAKLFGLNLPVLAGKGISITLDNHAATASKPVFNCKTPFILSEAKVAVSPFNGKIRFGGTMELGPLEDQLIRGLSQNRICGLLESASRYLPRFDAQQVDRDSFWSGFRPCTPDGLPIIGRAPSIDNLTVATGHAMMGLSLGPITGKLVSEIINGDKPSVDLTPFAINRFT
ncbi:FAD-binding oxidoreductase [Shewanella sp. UCD-KL12]|uniref:NAD(P)/FAD-dependent oxidoreductase n=1 Tax=Shewanella sp. UCD-KL12 TaxID=1917163 RepID=UPI000970A843|nr:FAD-dependent oxidoreductase [Shewanella sp. UCD-KL12]